MSLRRIFSLFIGIISLVGIFGSRKLPLLVTNGIGAGFAPLFFSLGLLLCAVLLFVLDKSGEKFDVRLSLLKGEHGKAFVFFLLNIGMLILMYLFGPIVAMLVFSILVCISLKRQTSRGLILFSVIWVGILYFIFAVLLKIPFDKGIVFEILEYI